MIENKPINDKREFHPVANIFPMMDQDSLDELIEDISKNGLLEAIWTDQDGKIIDGRNRYKACCRLGIQPTFQTWDGQGSLTEFVVSLNLKRRHLTSSQKACVALEIVQILAVEAKERQRIAGASYGRGKEKEKVVELFPQAIERSRNTAAKIVGTNPRYVSDAKKLKAGAPQVFDSIASGKLNIQEGKAIARLKEPQQKTVLDKIDLGIDVPDAIRETKREMVRDNYAAFKEEKGISKQEWWGEKLKGLPDEEKFEQLGISFQPYDVWNVNFCHDLFGSEHPGQVPGQLVMHTLAFYTKEGYTVIDPMAGSGTVIDVCTVMGRKCYGYDIDMRHGRSDILQHDMAKDGWPETIKEADLIFWDAPYYAKMDKKTIKNGYIEGSISGLNREDYLRFFTDSLAAAKSRVRPGTKLAFLMGDYDDPNDNTQDILIGDYWKIIEKAGWHIVKHIQTPLSIKSVHADTMLRFQISKQMGRLTRYLLVAEG